MEPADPEVAAYIAQWRPSSLSPQAAAFARAVIGQVAPEGRERAKNLLWAAGKLADYAIPLGLEPVPEVVLHPSTAERFTRRAPGLSGVARRTLRTNLRFIGRRVVPQLYPADMPLPRDHAKEPCSPAEIAGYLALAGAQPTPQRRMRASGADLPGRRRRADPRRPARRARHRRDLPVRRGDRGRPRRPAADGAGAGPLPRAAAGRGALCRDRADLRRGRSRPPQHHHPADPVAGRRGRAAPAGHLPAARHLASRRRGPARPATAFMHAAGITCSQRLGDLLAGLEPAAEADAVRLLGAARPS